MTRSGVVTGILGVALLVNAGCLSSSGAKRGDQHMASGNWEEAAIAYKEALKDDPFDPGLTGKYALARERAAALYEERGQAFLKERQFDLAVEQFKRALTIEPASLVHQASLAEAARLKEARAQQREAGGFFQLFQCGHGQIAGSTFWFKAFPVYVFHRWVGIVKAVGLAN